MLKTTLSRTLWLGLIFGLATASAEDHGFKLRGWSETVVNVSDLDGYIDFFESVAGWEVRLRGPVSRDVLNFWRLPASATAEQALVGNPGTDRGYIRLVAFEGVEQVQIRSNARTWDPGGILDLNVRVANMDEKFHEFQQAGWYAHSDPVQFTFGPFVVKEWIVVGPDGLSFALIERIQPELEGWPHLKEVSRAFNSTQVVAEMEPARVFFMDVLGFKKYLYHKGASKEPGPNVLGLPHNIATEIEREVWIINPEGNNEGSVELLAFEGLLGQNFAERAIPPNLGMAVVRFPVEGLADLERHLRNSGIAIEVQTTDVNLPYHKSSKLMAVRAPDGAWLEFYE